MTVAGESLQWDELASACVAHRNMLVDAGVEPGDRVAVWAKPTLGTAAAIVGNLAYGVVTVPLNPKLGTRERDHIL
ncbi:MAG: AMP-binding protein, partial [Deltaproteobacteria bacterium]|nr:AMP-binding protein [Deltaproteobacteria bacterium]